MENIFSKKSYLNFIFSKYVGFGSGPASGAGEREGQAGGGSLEISAWPIRYLLALWGGERKTRDQGKA